MLLNLRCVEIDNPYMCSDCNCTTSYVRFLLAIIKYTQNNHIYECLKNTTNSFDALFENI